MACVMSQTLTLADTSRRLLRVEIVPPKTIGNDNALIKLSLPHGTLLQPGAEIRVDGAPVYTLSTQADSLRGARLDLPVTKGARKLEAYGEAFLGVIRQY